LVAKKSFDYDFLLVGNNVSVNIEVDPRHPKMLPECYFLGADHGKAADRQHLFLF